MITSAHRIKVRLAILSLTPDTHISQAESWNTSLPGLIARTSRSEDSSDRLVRAINLGSGPILLGVLDQTEKRVFAYFVIRIV
ncbi:hypothetical protein Pst134EA_011917 [Puccinia striiformis f. sp. tritici]|uniref:hypothetical protein n=1 Tax=Puccinia striiformis f. sp. tritici TaxID=168172 RepID=UPI0020081E87|nr:hypothetical protein Pst134EA_011917 [Puccinia striiformis f. sp. tritici]KAH9456669.1 hypothetical protein Pst134EB_012873 [Puccinia striiformis f. sp. tritici]KAH9468294.1 hypothetical protein Pst134EA_011917 [Puccinia striiformis f. sp. tritici]